MKIFLTGATGFIGSGLAKYLQQQGHTLHLLCRNPTTPAGLTPGPHVRLFEGDLLDPDSLQRAVEGCEQVYHLAAYAKNWARDPDAYHQVNVTGTQHVLEAARRAGVRKLVYTSTAGALGPSDDQPMDEIRPRLTGFFNDYERTKFLAEELVKEYVGKGLPGVIVNPPRVFGPGLMSESNAATRIIDLYIRGRWRIILGKGERLGNYAFVGDVIEGHQLAMERGRPGERYILGGSNLSLRQYLDLIGEVSGRTYALLPLPVSAVMTFARWEEWRARHTRHYPVLTPSWIEKYKYDWALTSGKAERELQYRITPIREALRQTIAALRKGVPAS